MATHAASVRSSCCSRATRASARAGSRASSGCARAREFGAEVLTGQCVPYGDANVFVAVAEALRASVRHRWLGHRRRRRPSTRASPSDVRDACSDARLRRRAETERMVEGLLYLMDGIDPAGRRSRPARATTRCARRSRSSRRSRANGRSCSRSPTCTGRATKRSSCATACSPGCATGPSCSSPRPGPASTNGGRPSRASTTSSRSTSIRSTATPPPSSSRALFCGDADDETVDVPARTQRRQPVLRRGARRVRAGDARQRPAATSCPATLHGLVAARLDALDPAERSLLEDCAVVGAQRSDRGRARARRPAPTRAGCSTGSPNATSSRSTHDDFHFKSELIHEIAYGTLTKAERARRHAVGRAGARGARRAGGRPGRASPRHRGRAGRRARRRRRRSRRRPRAGHRHARCAPPSAPRPSSRGSLSERHHDRALGAARHREHRARGGPRCSDAAGPRVHRRVLDDARDDVLTVLDRGARRRTTGTARPWR